LFPLQYLDIEWQKSGALSVDHVEKPTP